jgi:hypothetical protein
MMLQLDLLEVLRLAEPHAEKPPDGQDSGQMVFIL